MNGIRGSDIEKKKAPSNPFIREASLVAAVQRKPSLVPPQIQEEATMAGWQTPTTLLYVSQAPQGAPSLKVTPRRHLSAAMNPLTHLCQKSAQSLFSAQTLDRKSVV